MWVFVLLGTNIPYGYRPEFEGSYSLRACHSIVRVRSCLLFGEANTSRREAVGTFKEDRLLSLFSNRPMKTLAASHRIQLSSGFTLDMQAVEGGPFEMRGKKVRIPNFLLGTFPVTNTQYAYFLNACKNDTLQEGPDKGQKMVYEHRWGVQKHGDSWSPAIGYERHPVIFVTWYGAVQFCEWLSQESKTHIDLPKEAEWAYAAQGGKKSQGFAFAGGNKLKELGWFNRNSHIGPMPIGLLQANELGLFDMSGNVWEWCEGEEEEDSAISVLLGGSWGSSIGECHVSAHIWDRPDFRGRYFGFRIAKYNKIER